MTIMAVPEASVDEDDHVATRENDVGLAGQIVPVKPKPIPEPMQQAANDAFRPGVSDDI